MATIQEYKCPCCGGAITFDSGIQKMKCPYCDTEFEMETLAAYDEALQADAADDLNWDTQPEQVWQEGDSEGVRIFVCDSCGGEIVGDENTAATACPYCGNPVVMMGNVSGELKPDLVIPFQLDKEAAKAAFMEHLQGKRLLPKVFRDENHIDEIKGAYVPFWLFDADADANVRYRGTRVHSWCDSKYNYTETSFYAILRSGKIGFDNVPVDGSQKMPDDLMESLEPFDVSKAVDFQTAYLAGYFADKYDVGADQCQNRAGERVKHSTEDAFRSTVGGFVTVTTESSHISLSSGKAKYALYPVWLLQTTWNGKQYLFAMNGQTGKFVGDLPMDKGLYWKWFAIIGGIGAAAAYGLSLLFRFL